LGASRTTWSATICGGAPKVSPGLTITEAECDAIFARDLVAYESVHGAGALRRLIAGDASAPGIRRLAEGSGMRIGERVARGNIHHHERVEDDLEAARLQVCDEPD